MSLKTGRESMEPSPSEGEEEGKVWDQPAKKQHSNPSGGFPLLQVLQRKARGGAGLKQKPIEPIIRKIGF